MILTLKVPSMIVEELRAGLRNILGEAAWDVSTAMDAGRVFYPQGIVDRLQRMDRARALLEFIGWTQEVNPEAVIIDLGVHRWAFMNGLERALVIGCENIEAVGKDKQDCKYSDENQCDRNVVRLLVLRQYLQGVETYLTAA
jgi:hypothetical protein